MGRCCIRYGTVHFSNHIHVGDVDESRARIGRVSLFHMEHGIWYDRITMAAVYWTIRNHIMAQERSVNCKKQGIAGLWLTTNRL